MPRCIRCDSWFYFATASSPAEDCDCGKNLSQAEARGDMFADAHDPSEDELEDERHGAGVDGEP